MKYHHPTAECDGNGQCSESCGIRQHVAARTAKSGWAQELVRDAIQSARVVAPAISTKCPYLGAELRDEQGRAKTVECPPCKASGGVYKLKTFACEVHGRCTTETRVAGVACCVGCPDKPSPIEANMGAGGLGDAMLGACAINGLRKAHPKRPIVYKVGSNALSFLQLFDLGHVSLGHHDWDHQNDRPPNEPNPGDLQMNMGNGYEHQCRGQFTRIERFCRNLGGVVPAVPQLRDREYLKAVSSDMAGTVVLSPFSAWGSREYPLDAWLAAEARLIEEGQRVVILDAPDMRYPNRHGPFQSQKIIGASAMRVVGILLNATCLVSNDSGLAHVGGILGIPTIVLCGQVTGKSIYGVYGPRMRYLEGHMACRGCWWQPPYNATCEPKCPNLKSIAPAEIVAAVTSQP